MEKKLTWEEIKKQYNQEWVLLDQCEWLEEEIDPRSGIVRFHAKDRFEFDRMLSTLESGFDAAIVFVGMPVNRSDVVITRDYSRVEYGN
jgi:hypothetical protein